MLSIPWVSSTALQINIVLDLPSRTHWPISKVYVMYIFLGDVYFSNSILHQLAVCNGRFVVHCIRVDELHLLLELYVCKVA